MSATVITGLEAAKKLLKKVSTKRPKITYRTRLRDESGREVGVFPGNDLPDIMLAPGRYQLACYATKDETGEVEEPEVVATLVVEPPPGEPEPEVVPETAAPVEWQKDPMFFLAERERIRAEADANARVDTMRDFYTNMQRIAQEANERADQRISEAFAESQKTLRTWGQPPRVVPEPVENQDQESGGFLDRFMEQHGELIVQALPGILASLTPAGKAEVVNGPAAGGDVHGQS